VSCSQIATGQAVPRLARWRDERWSGTRALVRTAADDDGPLQTCRGFRGETGPVRPITDFAPVQDVPDVACVPTKRSTCFGSRDERAGTRLRAAVDGGAWSTHRECALRVRGCYALSYA